jgi:ATP-dependent RNA helicase RhlE
MIRRARAGRSGVLHYLSFSDLGLSAELLRAVEEQGYQEATPVQLRAIPAIIAGRDILAGAQTGTGKTAGFTLPMLQRLQQADAGQRRTRRVRALVLAPTRELAAQVAESVANYGRHLPYRCAVIYGGVSINPQISTLRHGVDIVIATPGRLLDHMQRGTVRLDEVETLVLDEADRMLDMGFIRDIRRIIGALPEKRQNLLFSATFSSEIRQLAAGLLNRPEEIQVAPRNETAALISQVVHPVDKNRKRELLSHMIGAGNWRQVLVFTRTKHGANRLTKQLESDGLSAAAIHGNKSQGARTRALTEFKQGKVRVLVATDIAARGLDIVELPHVVNYELPNVPEDYVHRIGRTGRAGQDGAALSLVCVDEHAHLADIEKLLKRRIDQVIVPGYEPDPSLCPKPANRKGNSQRRGCNASDSTNPGRRQRKKRSRNRSSSGKGSNNGNWRRAA